MNSKPRSVLLTISILAVMIILSRLPDGSMAGHGIIHRADEMEVTLSTADRFLGVPSTFLQSPAGTLQFLGVPVVFFDYLINSHFQVSQAGMATYLSNLYREPWHAIILLRSIVAVVSGIGLALLFFPLLYLTGSRLLTVVTITAMATLPEVWFYSQMANADALALGLACAALVVLSLRDSDTSSALSGALIGFAIATKATFILAIPFTLAVALARSHKRLHATGLFTASLVIGLFLFCPYIWADPLRLAKSILGYYTTHGVPLGLGGSILMLIEIASIPVLLLAFTGLLQIVKEKGWFLLGGATLTILSTIIATSRAAVEYDRYFLVSIIPVIFLAGSGLGALKAILVRLPTGYRPGVPLTAITIVAVSMLVPNFFKYKAAIQDEQESLRSQALVQAIEQLHCQSKIAIPINLEYYFVGDASAASLEELLKRSRAFSSESGITDFATRRGISPELVQVASRSFTEDEQAYSARLNAMTLTSSPQGLDLVIWGHAEFAERFGLLQEQEIEALFARGELCAVVSETDVNMLQNYNDREFGEYRLYISIPWDDGLSQ